MELHRLARSFLCAEEPAIPIGEAGNWDSGLMDPGAVVYHDGSFLFFEAGENTTRTYLAT